MRISAAFAGFTQETVVPGQHNLPETGKVRVKGHFPEYCPRITTYRRKMFSAEDQIRLNPVLRGGLSGNHRRVAL